MKSQIGSPRTRLVLLSFLDVVDRTDILLHEMRQLQTALIHQLGLPELYQALRHEEKYLWGDADPFNAKTKGHAGWASAIEARKANGRTIGEASRELATDWVMRFPDFQDPSSKAGAGTPEPMATLLRNAVVGAANAGYLTQELRRIYYMISELQVTKQNLVREKIILVDAALLALGPAAAGSRTAGQDRALHALQLTCFAISAQLALRVPRVGNIQRQIEQLMDVSLEQDPRPSASRRRDQGIYNGAIVVRCLDFQRAMRAILDRPTIGEPDPLHPPGGPEPMLMHRWDLVADSEAAQDVDAMRLAEGFDPRRPAGEGYSGTRHLKSAYWMPDRPDMQPLLAQRIGRLEIESRYFGGTLAVLASSKGAFAAVLRGIRQVIEEYAEVAAAEGEEYWPLSESTFRHLLQDIGADLLAVLVSGPSYAFAAHLNLPGRGLETLLHGRPGAPDFDLDLQRHIFERLDEVTQPPIWYLRLRCILAMCRTLRAKDPASTRALDELLLDGISEATDLFYDGLVSASDGQDHQRRWELWKRMSAAAAGILDRNVAGRLVETAGQQRPEQNSAIAGVLRGAFLDRLVEYPRWLHRWYRTSRAMAPERVEDALRTLRSAAVEDAFDRAYVGPGTCGTVFPTLFASVFDVPWQWALVTTADLLAERDRIDQNLWLRQVQRLNWLGRDVFQLGLEHHVWYSRLKRVRLEACVRLVKASALVPRDRASQVAIALPQALRTLVDQGLATLAVHLPDWRKRAAVQLEELAIRTGVNAGREKKAEALLRELQGRLCEALPSTREIRDAMKPCDTPAEADGAAALVQLAELRDYLGWSLPNGGGEDATWTRLAEALGHCKMRGRAAIGRSRIHRIDRIAVRGHLLPPDDRQPIGANAPASPPADALRVLYTSPWVDSSDNRAWGSTNIMSPIRCLPLLGRFDLMRIESAKILAPSHLPYLSVTEWARGRVGPPEGRSSPTEQPFFTRQQFGLPFYRRWPETPQDAEDGCKIQTAWCCLVNGSDAAEKHSAREWLLPAGQQVGLAALSIQLAQRSARLTLLRQLLEEFKPWNAFRGPSPDPSRPDQPEADVGFLIDGWGDLLLLFNASPEELGRDGDGLLTVEAALRHAQHGTEPLRKRLYEPSGVYAKLHRRISEIFQLKRALDDHFLVAKTELAFTPIAGDVAFWSMLGGLTDAQEQPDPPLHWSLQIRLRPDRAGVGHARVIERVLPVASGEHVFGLVRQAHPLDVRLTVRHGANGTAVLDRLLEDVARQVRCLPSAPSSLDTGLANSRIFVPLVPAFVRDLLKTASDGLPLPRRDRLAAEIIESTATTISQVVLPSVRGPVAGMATPAGTAPADQPVAAGGEAAPAVQPAGPAPDEVVGA
jgi:hypothetical protein